MEDFTLLFDLDGTLVNTDNIYFEVWNEILIEYNLKTNDTKKTRKSILNYIFNL